MHREESLWIRAELEKYTSDQLSTFLNIGSSTFKFRSEDQPFIENEIFLPLANRNIQVIHSDIKQSAGVDLVGDITNENFKKILKKQNVSAILCSNMLEHVIDRETIIRNILDVIKIGGIVIVTVPYIYPKHLDPIDTLYRPTPKEISQLFHGTEILSEEILSVGKPISSLLKSPISLIYLLIRCLVPFYKYDGWITSVNKLLFLFKTRSVSCVILRKLPNH